MRHMASDVENHEMLSFYPKDMVIIFHSTSGYVIDRRKHRKDEVNDLNHARLYGRAKLAGV